MSHETDELSCSRTALDMDCMLIYFQKCPLLPPNNDPPCGTEGQLERSGSRTNPQDEPSQSFLCRTSLVTFPSLPDEKEFLQP